MSQEKVEDIYDICIKTELLNELPDDFGLYEDCNNYDGFFSLEDEIIERSQIIFKDIKIILNITHLQIEKFCIGRTYSNKNNGWEEEGIGYCWAYLNKNENYDFLLGFAVLTSNDDIPSNATLKQFVSQIEDNICFNFNDDDVFCGGSSRFDSSSLSKDTCNMFNNTIVDQPQVIYLAVKVRGLITQLPRGFYQFSYDCNIEENNYTIITDMLIKRVETILDDINVLLSDGNLKIDKFTIGKTFSQRYKKGGGWKVEGIEERWRKSYKIDNYDFLFAFAVIQRTNVPINTMPPFNNQQVLALGLENTIIQHFCFNKRDKRLDNKSLHPGKKNERGVDAGQVLYVAIKCCSIQNTFPLDNFSNFRYQESDINFDYGCNNVVNYLQYRNNVLNSNQSGYSYVVVNYHIYRNNLRHYNNSTIPWVSKFTMPSLVKLC